MYIKTIQYNVIQCIYMYLIYIMMYNIYIYIYSSCTFFFVQRRISGCPRMSQDVPGCPRMSQDVPGCPRCHRITDLQARWRRAYTKDSGCSIQASNITEKMRKIETVRVKILLKIGDYCIYLRDYMWMETITIWQHLEKYRSQNHPKSMMELQIVDASEIAAIESGP